MRNSAYEDAVNAEFVERVGKHIAAIRATTGQRGLEIAIDDLVNDYETTIGEIPAHEDDWDEDDE